MFTVKHVHLDGSEELHRSTGVRFAPGSERRKCTPVGGGETSPTPDTLWTDGGPLTGGTVFVMNENGKTVSRYDLGASPIGFSVDPHLTSHATKPSVLRDLSTPKADRLPHQI